MFIFLVSLFNPFLGVVCCMPGWQLGLALWRYSRCKGCLAAIKAVLKHRFMIVGREINKETPTRTVGYQTIWHFCWRENNNVLAKLMIYQKTWVRQLRANSCWKWWQNWWDWWHAVAGFKYSTSTWQRSESISRNWFCTTSKNQRRCKFV